MNETTGIVGDRKRILNAVFGSRVRRLWCPILTHYKTDGAIDSERLTVHLQHLSVHVQGILVPGSTGDGWELSSEETRRLLGIVLEAVCQTNLRVLIGILKSSTQETLTLIRETVDWLKARTNEREAGQALAAAGVCGFTICPPRGKDLTQEEIERGLSAVLEFGVPIAVYQLPQITGNEISPELAGSLAARFSNFIFFKDSSGADRVVQSKTDLGEVFTMRGAEGDYARWLKSGGGPYDGFLLSTANCFSRELDQIIKWQESGKREEAQALSDRLTMVVNEVFGIVKGVPHGNAFTNANKAMDHFFAYGSRAASVPAPRLHAAVNLPEEVLLQTGEVLLRNGFMPVEGYVR
jgi:dihydrodipicolinate synthase/N-acetylneuraminate lyase